MTTQLETLVAARALIAQPEHWTKGAMARNASGHNVPLMCDAAVAFCSVGAVERARVETGATSFAHDSLHAVLAQRLASRRPTHADVLALFDETIASLA